MGYIPSNFKKSDLKIIMSEEAYNRLAGAINLCGLYMGKSILTSDSWWDYNLYSTGAGAEFGTLLYGNIDGEGTIQLINPSKYDNYKLSPTWFSLSEEMKQEMHDNINQGKCQVVYHVHTHPRLQGDINRQYSEQDITCYKNLSSRYNNVIILGCMLSIGNHNVSNEDDISFVVVDPKTNGIYSISDIFVNINGSTVPLTKQQYVYTDPKNGQQYPAQRTMFEISDALINNSGCIGK